AWTTTTRTAKDWTRDLLRPADMAAGHLQYRDSCRQGQRRDANYCDSCHFSLDEVTKLSYHLHMPDRTAAPKGPKYQQVYRALAGDILSGRFQRGDRLPSEAELVRLFGASRITVGRAVKD